MKSGNSQAEVCESPSGVQDEDSALASMVASQTLMAAQLKTVQETLAQNREWYVDCKKWHARETALDDWRKSCEL